MIRFLLTIAAEYALNAELAGLRGRIATLEAQLREAHDRRRFAEQQSEARWALLTRKPRAARPS